MSKEIRLASHPEGMPRPENFQLVEAELNEPGADEVVVENIFLSVDPYMRGRMMDRDSYLPPFQLGETLQGGAVGRVIRSNHADLQPGDYVNSMMGWREAYVTHGSVLQKIDEKLAPISYYLGVTGMPGLTAYAGLLDIGQPKEGETVFVSAASGAVGSIVGQIAKIKGCRVVGSAGSEEKVRLLTEEFGFDAGFNYKTPDLPGTLGKLCPDGIDVYFDNVGGIQLEAAIDLMNPFGRIAACGMIGQYNDIDPPPGPKNLIFVVGKRLNMRGFIVSDHFDRYPAFLKDMGEWIATDRIRVRETVVDGIENMVDAFLGLFQGQNIGKMLVKLR